MTLNSRILAQLSGTYTKVRGLGQTLYTLSYTVDKSLADGLGTDQADLLYQSDPAGRTLAASTSENLDLAGPLVDADGDLLEFRHIKVVMVYARLANTNDVLVGAGTNPVPLWFSAPTTQTAAVPPDGLLLHTFPGAGWAVTPATGDILKIANSGAGTSVTYDIIIIGRST